MYEIVKNYRHDARLRASFNALAEKTFGLNFENWYQNGFWNDNYTPYSVVIEGQVAANVSLNRTDLLVGGERKRIYQLGTVMTEEAYRNRGRIRAIMAEIEKDTRDADGVYLFANDSVLEFYPRFGFRKGTECLYTRKVNQTGVCEFENIPMNTHADWAVLAKAMEENKVHSACDMVGNADLIFFYVSQFMQECVYYCKALDAYAIAEIEDGNLLLHNVFSANAVTLADVIRAFGGAVREVTLGFAPENAADFEKQELKEEDSTFFVKGEFFREFEEKKLRIPSLSHA